MRQVLNVVLALFVVLAAAELQPIRYDRYKVVEINVFDEGIADILRTYANDLSESGVLWVGDRADVSVGESVQITVSLEADKYFSEIIGYDNYHVIVDDLQATFDDNKERESTYPYNGYNTASRSNFFLAYRDYESIFDFVDGLVVAFPSLIRKVEIGKSHEGRSIFDVQISNFNVSATKPAVMWTGTQHSREWLSGHSLLYIVNSLVNGFGHDSKITTLLDSMVFHIIPVANPDGFAYSRATDNMWVKNRQPNPASVCTGTDLNRNWAFEWALRGSDKTPCSDSYHGARAYSAPETRVISSFLAANPSIRGFIDFHSSGSALMTPFGCYSTVPADYEILKSCADDAAAAVKSSRGTSVRVGSSYSIQYPTSGSAVDTTYGTLGRTLSFTFELGSSFQPTSTEIVPTGAEALAAALVHADYVLKVGLSK